MKVRAFIGNKWNPVTWGGDIWEDPIESEIAEP